MPQSAFLDEAFALCGNKICSVRNIAKSQPLSYNDALGLHTNVQDNDDIFDGEYLASVMPTTITKTTPTGELQLTKGWQVLIKIPEDKTLTSKSRITLQDDTEERIILKWVKSLTQNLYSTVLS